MWSKYKYEQIRFGIQVARSQWSLLPTRNTPTEYVDFHEQYGPPSPIARKAWRREQERIIQRDMIKTIERLQNAHDEKSAWLPPVRDGDTDL